MTNQEAARKLFNIKHDDRFSWTQESVDAFDLAISALQAQLTCNKLQQVATDTISRQEAIDAIEDLSSAQPEQDILGWLLAYHTKSFDLNGRYMAHEVIGWLVHDFANVYMTERREE